MALLCRGSKVGVGVRIEVVHAQVADGHAQGDVALVAIVQAERYVAVVLVGSARHEGFFDVVGNIGGRAHLEQIAQ